MSITLVFTFVGADRPGLVDRLSSTVAAHGGNWLESRMSELAGQFAGIVKVAVAADQAAALRTALEALSGPALAVVVTSAAGAAAAQDLPELRLSIVGNDRPGIMREVAHALAERAINVRQMDTHVTSAAMSGQPLFDATARIQLPPQLNLDELRTQLDRIADALTVDIQLEDLPR